MTAICFAALALTIVTIHTFAGPFGPKQSLEVTIAELVANTRQTANFRTNRKENM